MDETGKGQYYENPEDEQAEVEYDLDDASLHRQVFDTFNN